MDSAFVTQARERVTQGVIVLWVAGSSALIGAALVSCCTNDRISTINDTHRIETDRLKQEVETLRFRNRQLEAKAHARKPR